MATAQRDLIRLVAAGNKPGDELVMNRLQHAGLVHTDPADPEEAVTDSAAAATAFATGVKTFNGAIGVDAQERPVRTLLEDARRAGKATGLVTTSRSPTRRRRPTPRTSMTARSRARSRASTSSRRSPT